MSIHKKQFHDARKAFQCARFVLKSNFVGGACCYCSIRKQIIFSSLYSVVLMGNTSNFFEKKSRIWYLCIFVRDLKICKMFVIFSIKMFCVPANLALKKLCYVLKCLLDTDAFLLSNNDHLDINLSSKHQKIKLLVSLLFCFLSLRLPQSSNFLNFWTTSQHYTPTFFFLDGGTSFDNQISYLRKNSKFWSFGTIFPDRVIQNINFRTTTPSRNTDYLTLLTWYGTLGLVKETQ